MAATTETLRHAGELARAKKLLVRSLGGRGTHRARVVSLLGQLGFQDLPGESWVLLRELQDAGKLRASEVRGLGWLARRPLVVSDYDATVFTTPSSQPPPRVFIAGREFSSWSRVGDHHELWVPAAGLVAIRAEFHDGSSQAFVTVLQRDVRIRLIHVWGPTLEARLPGARCGLVPHGSLSTCGDTDVERVPIATAFDVTSLCGGPAAQGSAVHFGLLLLPSVPGIYTRDARAGLYFDPAEGAETLRCDSR